MPLPDETAVYTGPWRYDNDWNRADVQSIFVGGKHDISKIKPAGI